MKTLLFLLLTIIPSIAFSQVSNADGEYIYKKENFTNKVTLQGLNKITARVYSIDISAGETANFGNLEISMEKCWKAPPEQKPENKVLLKIWEQIPGEDKKEVFSGWMFSSSLALSALEHPVYDVTVLECNNNDAS